MQSYKISLHHLKTSIDGWPIVRNHRQFLSCTVTSFSFTGMKIDNRERKGVLENSSSLFPIRKRLWFIPSLLQIFASSTNCSGPRSGSGSRNLPAQQSPSACAPVLLKSTRSTQMLQGDLKLSSLPRAGVSQPAGRGRQRVPWLAVNGLGAALHHLHSLETRLKSSCLVIL